MRFLGMCGRVVLTVSILSTLGAPAWAAPPNVIVLITDDNGYGDLSCHGNPVLRTPNFDRLHASSVRLADFHVAPMCTPTRGQLLTGKDALRNGAMSVCAGRSFLRPGIPTMAELFAAAGYRTAMFGKWHLGDSHPNLPHQRGFQEAIHHLGWGITSIADAWNNDYFDGRFLHNGKLQRYPGYCTDVWFDQALSWIRDGLAARRPFFLYLPMNAAHGPHWVPEKYAAPYRGRGPAAFFGMMANLDENLGRLLDFLEENRLADDTIFVYLNDNGATAGAQVFDAGLRGRKTHYYEGGHRAACFVRWPFGKLGPPRDLNDLTEVQDLLPTLLDLCGIAPPAGNAFDGTSLAALLRGASKSLPDRKLVVQYGQRPLKWEGVVMWNKWRLLAGKELYDLASDPGQTADVAATFPEVVAEMRGHYESWWSTVEPRLDTFTPIVVGAEEENPVALTAADWANVYCDNMNDARAGVSRNGVWNLAVDRDGTYEVELRRWPREANLPLASGAPPFQAVVGGLPAGKALEVAQVRLKLSGLDETKRVAADATNATFTLDLRAGERLAMQGWLLDGSGRELAGAYFAYVRRR